MGTTLYMLALLLSGHLQGVPVALSEQAVMDAVALAGTFPVAEQRHGPQKTDPASLGVVTSAPSVIVTDVASGEVLFESGADTQRSIASITKLMTAVVLLEEYEWSFADPAEVYEEDYEPGGRIWLPYNTPLTMDDLFSTMIVGSGNNEALGLVRAVGATRGSFATKMNNKARELGMLSSHFVEPTGLDPRNSSTTRDIVRLLDRALGHQEIAVRMQNTGLLIEGPDEEVYRIDATNHLFSTFLNEAPYAILGAKTGTLDEAGYCLTTRIARDGHAIDIALLGATSQTSRFDDAQDVASWVYDVYAWEL